MSGTTQVTPGPVEAGVTQRTLIAVSVQPTGLPAYALHAGLTLVRPGGRTSSIQHDVHELVVVAAGTLTMRLGEDATVIVVGDHVVIEPGVWHSFENHESAEAAMVFAFGGDPGPVTRRVAATSPVISTGAVREGAEEHHAGRA